MASVLVDTGVWLALCDPKDRTVEPEVVDDIYERVRVHSIILPWPIAYETLRTRFVRNRIAMARFEQELKSPNIIHVDDAPYRQDALSISIQSSLRLNRPLSMVDCMLRLLLDDRTTRIQYLVTFNQRDFIDVCRTHKIELWSRLGPSP